MKAREFAMLLRDTLKIEHPSAFHDYINNIRGKWEVPFKGSDFKALEATLVRLVDENDVDPSLIHVERRGDWVLFTFGTGRHIGAILEDRQSWRDRPSLVKLVGTVQERELTIKQAS